MAGPGRLQVLESRYASTAAISIREFNECGPGHLHQTGARSFEQVVLRRDLERWIGGGGKVESPDVGPKRAAIMYSAHPVSDLEYSCTFSNGYVS